MVPTGAGIGGATTIGLGTTITLGAILGTTLGITPATAGVGTILIVIMVGAGPTRLGVITTMVTGTATTMPLGTMATLGATTIITAIITAHAGCTIPMAAVAVATTIGMLPAVSMAEPWGMD